MEDFLVYNVDVLFTSVKRWMKSLGKVKSVLRRCGVWWWKCIKLFKTLARLSIPVRSGLNDIYIYNLNVKIHRSSVNMGVLTLPLPPLLLPSSL